MGGGLLTHCGTRGAAARPPPPPAICSGGEARRAGLSWVGGRRVGFPNSPCSFPREPSGRDAVTVCLFPRLPREAPPGQSFLIHPLMHSGALALGIVPGTSSRLGRSVNSSGRKAEGGGVRDRREEQKRKRLRVSVSAEAQTISLGKTGIKSHRLEVWGLGDPSHTSSILPNVYAPRVTVIVIRMEGKDQEKRGDVSYS